jgi:hypothetical protein
MRGSLESWEGRGQFAGHETFPLRLLWLKKAFDAVERGAAIGFFHEPEAIARFGVGRNMAVSMRHWATAAGIIEEKERQLIPTALGRALLADDGWDPYLERPATLWLTHWLFASEPSHTTTIYFAFNAIAASEFDATSLAQGLESVVAKRGWRASSVTIKRDVEVFLRSYVRRHDGSIEDAAEPVLAELGLLRGLKPTGSFEFVRGPKPTLPDAVFAYAVSGFWKAQGGPSTLSAEQICYGPGSPGRVFKLDEDSIVARLMRLEGLTSGGWLWTETAGLKQLQKRRDLDSLRLLGNAYGVAAPNRRRAA